MVPDAEFQQTEMTTVDPPSQTELAVEEDQAPQEFPVPGRVFAKTLARTHEEIWTHWLMRNHGRENHTPTEWRVKLDALKSEK